jgi:quercetin 2,3-dioxygenase
VLGEHGGARSPLRTLTPVTLLDIKLPKGANFSHVVPKGWNAFLLVLKGKLTVGPEKTDAPRHSAIGFAVEGDTIDFTASEDSHVIVATGEPLSEPIVMDGPFVANSREQIKKMQNDYLQGKMGKLKKSF